MAYVDGYLIALPTKNLKAYKAMARLGGKVWRDHGALDYKECVGDDLATKFGTPYPKLMKLRKGETAVFSWITYRNKAQRDKVNAKVMQDPRMKPPTDPKSKKMKMPFDMKRMSFGGFTVLVDA
jgi:uncharacterized protein YbaA (DUF1428 family)